MPDDMPGQVDPPLPKEQGRALLYQTLAVLWVFPSLGAAWILGMGFRPWRGASGFTETLGRVRLEDWVAMLLLAAHLFFLYKTAGARRSPPSAR